MAEHSLQHVHEVLFNPTEILASSALYGMCMIRDALEIKINSKVLNQDLGLQLSKTWRLVIRILDPEE